MVNVYHLSTIHEEKQGEMLSKGLEFIWKEMCCQNIKISLYHFADTEGGKLHVNNEIKQHLKALGFKWKQITNNQNGARVEYMEAARPAALPYIDQR